MRDVAFIGDEELMRLQLPGAASLIQKIHAGNVRNSGLVENSAATATPTEIDRRSSSVPDLGANGSAISVKPSTPLPSTASQSLLTVLSTATERELLLEAELVKERDKNVTLQLEVDTLKATIVQLQTALGLALAVIVTLALFLSLFVSMTTIISFVAIAIAALQFCTRNAVFLLTTAVRGLFAVLGPTRSVILCVILFGWLTYHGVSDMRTACPPVKCNLVDI